MPLSTEGRLLCAATQAYAIKANGPVPDTLPLPNPPRSALAGYAAPIGFASGADLIDAGLLGVAPDAIIVAFRGTLPPGGQDVGQIILDWANDANVPLGPGANLPGQVHQGFLGALDALWGAMGPAIAAAVAAHPGLPIWVSGHSKGGAMAYLGAMRIKAMVPNVAVLVRTFAAARAGDLNFVNAFNAAIPNCLRFEYADDIVPHLPPEPAFAAQLAALPLIGGQLTGMEPNYESAGVLQYITARAPPGAPPQPDSPALEDQRRQSLISLLTAFQFQTIADDHSMNFGSGYSQAVCPGS